MKYCWYIVFALLASGLSWNRGMDFDHYDRERHVSIDDGAGE